jgi:hypothetical protein
VFLQCLAGGRKPLHIIDAIALNCTTADDLPGCLAAGAFDLFRKIIHAEQLLCYFSAIFAFVFVNGQFNPPFLIWWNSTKLDIMV